MFWSQRARSDWLNLGDRNSSFFHASTIQRQHKNTIKKLKIAEDTWVEEEEKIKDHIINFFKNLFSQTTENTQTRRVDRNFENLIPKVVTP
ncbi:hypothetical protein LINGRAHAP2_LOCUS548 [Linum grandiflorum]